MRVIRSWACRRRQTWMALRAPGVSAGSKVAVGGRSTTGMRGSQGWGPRAVRDKSFFQAGGRFRDDVVDHRPDVPGPLPDAELAVGPGAVLQDLMDIGHFLPAPKLVDLLVDELEELEDKGRRVHLLLLPEIDQLAGDAIARGAPAVFVEQPAPVQPPGHVLL